MEIVEVVEVLLQYGKAAPKRDPLQRKVRTMVVVLKPATNSKKWYGEDERKRDGSSQAQISFLACHRHRLCFLNQRLFCICKNN